MKARWRERPALFVRHFARRAQGRERPVSEPIELLVENTDYYKTYKLDYHGGERIRTWCATNRSQIC
jgi:hypothetical protein